MPHTTRPLYVSIAIATKNIMGCQPGTPVNTFTKDCWESYLKRCERELPLNAAVIIDDLKKDVICISGAFHPYGSRTQADYSVRVTPSLSDGFYLRITCNDRNLRDLVHESFYEALARKWPVSQFFEKEIEPCPS